MPTKRTNSDFEGHFKSFMNYIYFNYSSKNSYSLSNEIIVFRDINCGNHS